MSKSFKPLLAEPVDFSLLDYSNCWLSPKIDGIRGVVLNGVVMSRKLIPIPNLHVQRIFGGDVGIQHWDGELIVGAPNDQPYDRTYSGVMTIQGEPDVTLYAFDHVEAPNDEYFRRYDRLRDRLNVVKVPQHPVTCYEDILALEARYVDEGYEGVMLRTFQSPNSFYKYGRSTANELTLLKLKRFTDFEARITGIEEEMFNGNEAKTDALGNTKRSSHAENKTGKGTLGKMLCEDLETGMDFKCGIFKGYKAAWKKQVWATPTMVVGQIGKFQRFGLGGKGRPRHPKFLGIRSPIDM